jgi:uncharacterized protein YbjT (DUF2867 family)
MSLKVVVIGATGVVGSQVVEALIKHVGIKEVVTLTRKPVQYNSTKVLNVVINFEEIENYSKLLEADILFSCLGTTLKQARSLEAQKKVDVTYQYKVAKIASEQGITNYSLVSSSGANVKSSNAYLQMKGELESLVLKLNFSKVSIFQPSLLLGKRSDLRVGELIGKYILPVLCFIPGLKKYAPIKGEVVAKKMLEVALNNEVGLNYYRLDEISC